MLPIRTSPAVLALTLAALLAGPALAERQLGTIGPPPKKSPQRKSSAESVPPLPLPATPMRRSEPKAEPKGPTFVARLAYGETQDYMPNPGDLENLLGQVRKQVNTWYGKTMVKMDALVEAHQKGQRYKAPLIYMVGYQPFSFNEKQRAALRHYLVNGGTLMGMAALGSPAFNKSFKQEMSKIFPKRRLDRLQLDHPIMRAYYDYQNVEYFTVNKGHRTRSEGPPQLMGLNIKARTAVILSPYDMTCGWDEFYAPSASERVPDAPRTKAMMPGDAIRMGINMISYVAAQRRFAQAQAETRQIAGTQPRRRAAVTLGHLRHHGDWNADPNSLYQLLRLAADRTSAPMAYDLQPVDPVVEDLAETPLLIMTGMDDPQLSSKQVHALRRHLQAGGFLFINNTSGYTEFDKEARAMIGRIFPDRKLKQTPKDHPLLHQIYDTTRARGHDTHQPRPVELYHVLVRGKAAIVYSPNDTLAMLKGIHDPYANAYDAASARKIALNILTYAMQR